jgi:hypothetical protein
LHSRALVAFALSVSSVTFALPALADGSPATLSGMSGGATVDKASAAEKKKATQAYLAGKKAYDAGNFEGASEQFEKSYATVASPNSLLMLAQSLEQRGKLPEAYRAYVQTREDAAAIAPSDAKYEKTRDAADAAAKKLEASLSFVDVKADRAEGTLTVAGREVTEGERTSGVAATPGSIEVTLTKEGEAPVTKSLTAKAGERVTADFSPPKTEAKEEPSLAIDSNDTSSPRKDFIPHQRTVAYAAAGVGAVGLATFAIFGVMNNSKYSDLESSCSQNRCASSENDNIDSGRTYQTIANVGLVFGVVGLGAGAALYFTSSPEGEGAKETAGIKALRVGPGNVRMEGTF